MEHRDEAKRLLEKVEEAATEAGRPELLLGMAAVHAVLSIADAIGHGLRDIVYEIRD